MYFLFSGEGPTDLGMGVGNSELHEGDAYHHGPMTVIVDQIVEEKHEYSLLETGYCGFVRKQTLVFRASELKAAKKALRLPGKKRAKETRYFFTNARMLARIAMEKQGELNDDLVAVLFRDADTASAGRGVWDEKRQSMVDGFKEEGFARGVPMIPKPTSETWLLCALKRHPYRGCAALEERSGGDRLKEELAERVGHVPTRRKLCEMVTDRKINVERISMPSFAAFRSRLEEVI